MKHSYVLAIDPSGNFNEGKGMTGWALLDANDLKVIKFGVISASKFDTQEEYWAAHLELIDGLLGYKPLIVVEDYMLYANRARSQINSKLETPRLLGAILMHAWFQGIKLIFQPAAIVKSRWTDNILVKKGVVEQDGNRIKLSNVVLVDHIKDAIRHGVHVCVFKIKDL